VSDQWSTYGTKVIVPTAREAHFVLDDFLGNATDLPVAEHATDTHGATLINFALFDLVGKALTPRMRRVAPAAGRPVAGPRPRLTPHGPILQPHELHPMAAERGPRTSAEPWAVD
jgi:Tn3 transposase DDE domain